MQQRTYCMMMVRVLPVTSIILRVTHLFLDSNCSLIFLKWFQKSCQKMLKFAASFKQNLWKMAWLTRTAILESIPILVSVIYSGKWIAHILAFDIRHFSPSMCKCSAGKEMWASSNRTDLKNTTTSRTSRYMARDTLLMLFKKLIPRIQRDFTRALRIYWTTRHTTEHGEMGGKTADNASEKRLQCAMCRSIVNPLKQLPTRRDLTGAPEACCKRKALPDLLPGSRAAACRSKPCSRW